MFKNTQRFLWKIFVYPTISSTGECTSLHVCTQRLRNQQPCDLTLRYGVKKPKLNLLAHWNRCHDFLKLFSQLRLWAWGWQYWHCPTESTKPNSEWQSISFPSLILSLLYTASSNCWNLAVAMSSSNLCLPLANMKGGTAIHSTLPPPQVVLKQPIKQCLMKTMHKCPGH